MKSKQSQASSTFDVDFIKSEINIVDLVNRDENLVKQGDTFRSGHQSAGHDSKSGTCLDVSPGKQVYFCRNCSESGDIFAWVMSRDNCSFVEAAQWLCETYHIPFQTLSPEEKKRLETARNDRERIRPLMKHAFAFYNSPECLTDERREYLHGRGITDETIDELLIGFAPSGGRMLAEHMNQKFGGKINKADMFATGLFFRNEKGAADVYQGRFVFPYWKGGEIVFSIARLPGDVDEAKLPKWNSGKYYKHPVYKEDREYISLHAVEHVIYGIDSIRGKPEVIITEGIIDAILAHQHGFACLSPVTVKFSNSDIGRLCDLTKYAETVYIVNDNEESKAGLKGAVATAETLFEAGRDVRIVQLKRPEGLDKIDLADYFASGGHAKGLNAILADSPDYIEFQIDIIVDMPRRKQAEALVQLVEQIAGIENEIQKEGYLNQIVERGLSSKRAIQKMMGKAVAAEKQMEQRERRKVEHAETKAQLELEGVPVIETTDRHLRNITADTIQALKLKNQDDARIFVRGGHLTRLKWFDDSLVAEPLSQHALRGEMARAASYLGGRTFAGEAAHRPVSPPVDAVNDLISLPSYPDFPSLNEITQSPIFAPDGSMDTSPGYQPKTKTYYNASKKLDIRKLESSDNAVEKAKSLIFDELLSEFDFADQASRANALALMLLPFVRLCISGPAPLHLIDAPTEGTGKGLLADVLVFPSKPDGATLMTEGESDEEWRKRITAALSEATSHVLIDNISSELNSPSLAAVLTTRFWSDRLLGTNSTVKFPVTQTWIATGNNVKMSNEIRRRVVWIRLRPLAEDPSMREFKIKNLRKWAQAHRSKLVNACLTLVKKWVDEEMLEGDIKKGSYEEWAAVMSGIMKSIGVEGFMENYSELRTQANDESIMWHEFVHAWHDLHGVERVGVADLFNIAATFESTDEFGNPCPEGMGLLNDLLPQKTVRGQRTKLGALLKTQVDRVYGDLRIQRDVRKKQAAGYRLEALGEPSEPQNGGSPTGSPADKHSDSKALQSKSEPSEPQQHLNGFSEGEDSISSNDEINTKRKLHHKVYQDKVEEGSPGSPEAPRPNVYQGLNPSEPVGEPQRGGTPDTQGSPASYKDLNNDASETEIRTVIATLNTDVMGKLLENAYPGMLHLGKEKILAKGAKWREIGQRKLAVLCEVFIGREGDDERTA